MNDLLQALEDKVVALVDELEGLRAKLNEAQKENQELKANNQSMQSRVTTDQDKLEGILSLLDTVVGSAPAQAAPVAEQAAHTQQTTEQHTEEPAY